MFILDEIIAATQGTILQKRHEKFHGITTDSRKQSATSFFIPLKGENFDGHNYIKDAFLKGSRGAFIQKGYEGILPNEMTIVVVEDTLKALQTLAHFWRKKHAAEVVAITGSNGKTTTKFFLKQLLSPHKKIVCSEKSFNNHIGVPLTLLKIDSATEVCIVEIGTNHSGEIRELTKLAEPNFAVITTIGNSHLEGLGSLEGVAKEKLDIFRCSPQEAKFALNMDNEFIYKFASNVKDAVEFSSTKATPIKFLFQKSTLQGIQIQASLFGKEQILTVPVLGKHNLTNLMAASALASLVGLTPEQIFTGLKTCTTTWGRSELLKSKHGKFVFFDAYNANPDSMLALFDLVKDLETEGEKFLVLGDMLELGERAEEYHQELGGEVANLPVQGVLFMGNFAEAFEAGVASAGFQDNAVISKVYKDLLAKKLVSMLQPEDIVFVKGSRGAKLERLLDHFEDLESVFSS